MKDKNNFRVGHKIIRYGKVYRIFKIEDKKNLDGKIELNIFYRPFFKVNENQSIVCSVPLSSLSLINIRRPVSKDKIKHILKFLGEKPVKAFDVSIVKAGDYLRGNSLRKSARFLKYLWLDKQNSATSFSLSKRMVYERVMGHLSEEIAVVERISLSSAAKKVVARLEKIK